jgi:hypothetical protein
MTWLAGEHERGLTMFAGVVMAYTGFSPVAMAISMPTGILLLAWIISVGVFMRRRDNSVPGPISA